MAVGRIINPGEFPQINRLDKALEGARPGLAAPVPAAGTENVKAFGDLVSEGISKVNGAVRDFETISNKFSHGERVNIHEMMVKGEQADMSLRLMLSLRNKVVEAYQDVMRLAV